MRKIFVGLFLLAFLACQLPAQALNEWTVMLYLVSDDSKSQAMIDSHVETLNKLARNAGKSPQYEVVILIDAPPGFALTKKATKKADGGFSLEPGQDGKWNIAAEHGEVNMGSPYTLWNFLKWTSEKHPAKKYALFIGGHGSGIFSWRGEGNVSSANPGAVSFNPDRFVGYDDTDDDCLTIFEVKAVLEAFKSRLTGGRALDTLVLDSCLPGAIEALYQFRDIIRIMVSSPSTTLIGGMPYVQLISKLAAKPSMTDEEFGAMVAESYVKNLSGDRDEGEVMGVYRPAETQALVGALDQLSLELINAVKAAGKFPIKNLTTYGGKKRYWDLGRLLRSFTEGGADLSKVPQESRIKALAGEALEALKSSRVTTWYSGGYAESKVAGLSIAWPEKEEYSLWKKFYSVLDFAQTTHWDEFLNTWNSGESR
ncbi:MAG: clostripain-related cysteine peptidase [Candidatus Ozemobacteraceae bacterium]